MSQHSGQSIVDSRRSFLPDLRQPAAALNTAVTLAGLAPSIHNTQPWHWRLAATGVDLWAERRRRLAASDPDGRLLTVSCGAALHHAQTALAALGYRSIVLPFPDPARSDHLAGLSLAGPVPVTAAVMRLFHAIGLRSTQRRPGRPVPLDSNALLRVIIAAQSEGCFLQPLRPDQVVELAAIVARAQDAQAADPAWRAEIARWSGGTRRGGTGVPEANIPDHRPHTTVAQRDFGHPGTLPVGDGHHAAASYAILYGVADEPEDWLTAGRALSHAWLAATDAGIAVMPVSAPVEVPAARRVLRRMLPCPGYPYLVLRLSEADERLGPPPTPRLPSARVLSAAD
jgi:nitroreductase